MAGVTSCAFKPPPTHQPTSATQPTATAVRGWLCACTGSGGHHCQDTGPLRQVRKPGPAVWHRRPAAPDCRPWPRAALRPRWRRLRESAALSLPVTHNSCAPWYHDCSFLPGCRQAGHCVVACALASNRPPVTHPAAAHPGLHLLCWLAGLLWLQVPAGRC